MKHSTRPIIASLITTFVLAGFLCGAEGFESTLTEQKDKKGNTYSLTERGAGDKSTFYLNKSDKNGKQLWSVTLWEKNQGESGFIVTVSKKGEVKSKRIVKPGEYGPTLDIYIRKHMITVVLNENKPIVIVTRGEKVALDEALEKEETELRSKKYHDQICGVLAFVKLMSSDQFNTTGDEVISAITKKQPDFGKTYPKIYGGISDMTVVQNSKGTIDINTREDYLNLKSVRIRNQSNVSVSQFENGNMKIVVKKGITVGKAFIQFDLNYIDIEASTGNMVFNYGKGKEKKVHISEILKK